MTPPPKPPVHLPFDTDMGGPTQAAGAGRFIGQVFDGKYRIISEINKGGMGRIFKAEQIALNRAVAIKIITASDDQVANQRFLLEASLTANLDHPNIVQIFDFGRTKDGVLFLVMELLSGDNLRDWVQTNGPLSVADALQVIGQLCGALSEAHAKNVIHRDIKPSNIIVSRRAGAGMTAKLIDFGLVKNVDQNHGMSRTGMLLGTPMFMAPEQITASGVDDRVDIYALGLTLHFALTGNFPYPERGLNALIHAQLTEELEDVSAQNPSIPADHLINWIVQSAIAKDPMDRFQNTLQMLETVQICANRLDSSEFPTIQIDEGVLSSDDEVIVFSPDTPSTPLVDGSSYVKDGSAISKDFAETLYMSGMVERTGETFVVSSGTSLAIPGGPPVSGEIQPPPATKWFMLPAILLVAAIGGAAVFVLRPTADSTATTAKTPQRATIEVQSVPEGADVLRDGKLIGSTPFKMLADSDGTTTIELQLKGYESRTVELSSNRPVVVVRLNKVEVAVPEPAAPMPAKATPRRNRTPARDAGKRKAAKAAPTPRAGPRDPWAD